METTASGGDRTPESSLAPTIIVQYPSGQRTLVDDISDIEEELPFRIVLPEDLPLGLKLRMLNGSLPGKDNNNSTFDSPPFQPQVLLNFASDDGTVTIQLNESAALTKITSPNSRILSVRETEVTVLLDPEHELVTSSWGACGIGFVLTGGPSDVLTDGKLLQIVEATIEACK